MKKTVFFFIVVVTLLLSVSFVSASQKNYEPGFNDEDVKVISLDDIKRGTVAHELIINQSSQQHNYLNDYGATLRYLGSGRLDGLGYTRTGQNVDTINTIMYLQQYDESRRLWVSIHTISNTLNNASYSQVTRSYSVPVGARYRLQVIHEATVGGQIERISTYSSVANTY
ncbi:hypothetical protein [Alkaliphilus metalliredigens]|nr:hypothetical protein [Alkaliphilus metalliredigens]